MNGICQVSVDWIGNNIFVAQKYPAERPGISVCSMDGVFCRLIVRGDEGSGTDSAKRQTYQGSPVVSPQNGLIFWIETYNGVHMIMAARMDDTNPSILWETRLGYLKRLALRQGKLYFGDTLKGTIEIVDIVTRERQNGRVKRTDLRREELTVYNVLDFDKYTYDIVINHAELQPSAVVNPCSRISCSWMCVIVPRDNGQLEPICLAPDSKTDV